MRTMTDMMNEVANRRDLLIDKLNKPCLLILDSASNVDDHLKFRQNSDFFYYTNLSEPDSTLVLFIDYVDKTKKNFKTTSYLFMDDISHQDHKRWHGSQISSMDNIKIQCMIDHLLDRNSIQTILKDMIIDNRKNYLYYNYTQSNNVSTLIQKLYDVILFDNINFFSIQEIIHHLRGIKSPYEVELIRTACNLTAKAFIRLMKDTNPEMIEYQLNGIFTGQIISLGCSRLAYPTIIGSGYNGTILHNINYQNRMMQSGDLVLVDAGGEYQSYASDITRTWPVNGKYTPAQVDIYTIVLNAQQDCLDYLKKNRFSCNLLKLHEIAIYSIVDGLIKIGILKDHPIEYLINIHIYNLFFMHFIGHWLGLDVHDCETLSTNTLFQSGHVFTLEPGVYIDNIDEIDENKQFMEYIDLSILQKYKGIGIRIEDDILITNNGYEILSNAVPKEINQIEALIDR